MLWFPTSNDGGGAGSIATERFDTLHQCETARDGIQAATRGRMARRGLVPGGGAVNDLLPAHMVIAAILAAHLGGNAENVARDVVRGLRRAGYALVAAAAGGAP